MFDYKKIHDELERYLGAWLLCYDLEEIMSELRDYTNEKGESIQSIDDVSSDDFQDILNRHDHSKA